MKAVIEDLLASLFDQTLPLQYELTGFPHFHPKKQGKLRYRGECIGQIGALHPLTLKHFKISEHANVVFAEIDQEKLLALKEMSQEKHYPYETIQDQILRRDLSFVLPETADFSALLESIQALPEVKDLQVFDIYQGDNLPAGKKSLSLKCKLLGEGNMTSEQVGEILGKIIQTAKTIGAELRA